jgi:cyclopropane-fatty-acyl-phospholipid synthase
MRILFEHVGLAYLAADRCVLRPGGLFLNYGITHNADGRNKTVATDLINRDVS